MQYGGDYFMMSNADLGTCNHFGYVIPLLTTCNQSCSITLRFNDLIESILCN